MIIWLALEQTGIWIGTAKTVLQRAKPDVVAAWFPFYQELNVYGQSGFSCFKNEHNLSDQGGS